MRNLALLGVGAFAVYWLFFRKTTTAGPLLQLPGPVAITPQIVGTQVPYVLPPSGGSVIPGPVNITPQIIGTSPGLQPQYQPASGQTMTDLQFQQTYGFDPSLLVD